MIMLVVGVLCGHVCIFTLLPLPWYFFLSPNRLYPAHPVGTTAPRSDPLYSWSGPGRESIRGSAERPLGNIGVTGGTAVVPSIPAGGSLHGVWGRGKKCCLGFRGGFMM